MNKLFKILSKKENFPTPPIWIMRQAGRYLPEYREVRSSVKNFLELCYTPELACEVTLQPIRRFGFDAAIIFSDILVLPEALGIKVEFIEGIGPKLQRISNSSELKHLNINNVNSHLRKVYEAIELTKIRLDLEFNGEKDLIGFSGSPFTLACYMIEGGGSKDFSLVRKAAICNEEFFLELINILSESVIQHVSNQIEAGVNVVKLFDSWAGILPPHQLKKWVLEPTKKIVSEIRKKYPTIPIICFPRGIGTMYEEFVHSVNPHGLAIDQNISHDFVKSNLQTKTDVIIQGNLDNFLLAFGSKKEIEKEVLTILKELGSRPFIFNLGHGILPETPIENVEFLTKLIRQQD